MTHIAICEYFCQCLHGFSDDLDLAFDELSDDQFYEALDEAFIMTAIYFNMDIKHVKIAVELN